MQKKPPFFQRFAAVFAEGSRLMQTVSILLTLAALNISCLLCFLPVITGGGALTALYTLLPEVHHLSFDAAFRRFFRLVQTQWKRTLVPWLLALAAGGALVSAWWVALTLGLTNRFFPMLPLLLTSAVVGFCLLWLFPVLAAQETGSWAYALQTAALLGLRELLRSVLLVTVEAVLVLWMLWCTLSLTRMSLWLFFGIAPLAWIKVWILQPALHGIYKNP